MALPTLRPYYVSRGKAAQQERLIVRRRTQEDDRRQQWTDHYRYFTTSNIQVSKQEGWTSSKSFQDRWACGPESGGVLRVLITRVVLILVALCPDLHVQLFSAVSQCRLHDCQRRGGRGFSAHDSRSEAGGSKSRG